MLPSDTQGEYAVRGYLGDHPLSSDSRLRRMLTRLNPFASPVERKYGPFKPSKEFERRIIQTPGLSSSIYRYLNGSGRDKIPALVDKAIGGEWYAGLAKRLAKTDFGRNVVIDKVLEKTLPRVGGKTDFSRWFMERGGLV